MSIILDALEKTEDDPSHKTESSEENANPTPAPKKSSSKPIGKSPYSGGKKPKGSNRRIVTLLLFLLFSICFYVFRGQIFEFYTAFLGDNPQPAQNRPIQPHLLVKNQPTLNTDTSGDKEIDAKLQEEVQLLKEQASNALRESKLDQALKFYGQLQLKAPTDPEVLNNYGVALRKSGQVEEAKFSYEQALKLKPQYPEAMNNLAVLYMADNKYNSAKRLLRSAIKIDPNYIDPYLHLAICLEKMGQVGDAIKHYEAFLEMSVGKVERKVRLQVEDRLAKLKN